MVREAQLAVKGYTKQPCGSNLTQGGPSKVWSLVGRLFPTVVNKHRGTLCLVKRQAVCVRPPDDSVEVFLQAWVIDAGTSYRHNQGQVVGVEQGSGDQVDGDIVYKDVKEGWSQHTPLWNAREYIRPRGGSSVIDNPLATTAQKVGHPVKTASCKS